MYRPSAQLEKPKKVSGDKPTSLAVTQYSLTPLQQVIQQRCNQKVIHFALILNYDKCLVFISPSQMTSSGFRRLTVCKETIKSKRKTYYAKYINKIEKDSLQLSFKFQWFGYTFVLYHRDKWPTCVTRGSRSLSTVRVRISRLLGSHFNRMGEVAVVMVSVGSKNTLMVRRMFCCEKLSAH